MVEWTQLVWAVASLVAAIAALYAAIYSKRTHSEVNSRMSEMIEMVREEGRLSGIQEQKDRGGGS